jgi:predicted nucleotidyltransferase
VEGTEPGLDAEFDTAAAARALMDRERRKRDQCRHLHERASRECARIVEMVVHDFRPRRVLQWGSLLEPEQFDEHSDIDIAVEGLAGAGDFMDLLGRALDMSAFPLDLVELESLDGATREHLLRRAKVVYERD